MTIIRRPRLLFALFLLAALVICFPLRALIGLGGLGDLGLSARSASGSIWRGSLVEAQIGGVPLGNIGVRLAPLALLAGKAKLLLKGEGQSAINGSVHAGVTSFGADVRTATIPLGSALSPLPPASLSLVDARFAFSGGRCTMAEGQVRMALDAMPEGLEFGKSLIGTGRCDVDAVAATLVGASGMEKIIIRIRPDGRYVATIIVRVSESQARAKLGALGFRESAAGYVRRVEGAF
jgi:general secretion pathway protein N